MFLYLPVCGEGDRERSEVVARGLPVADER